MIAAPVVAGAWSTTLPALPAGRHRILVRARDAAGHWSAPASLLVTVPAVVPIVLAEGGALLAGAKPLHAALS